MKILIIDDERPALNLLNDTLQRLCDEKDVIVPFKSVREFESYEDKAHFDAAFIDIEIGKVSGIQFALELKNYSPKCNIVFVTSFDKYGTEAFKTRPSGYVLKPLKRNLIISVIRLKTIKSIRNLRLLHLAILSYIRMRMRFSISN